MKKADALLGESSTIESGFVVVVVGECCGQGGLDCCNPPGSVLVADADLPIPTNFILITLQIDLN